MPKTILVTGGLGFIGSNFIERLLKTTDYQIIILDKETYAGKRDNIPNDQTSKKRIHIILGDVTKKQVVDKVVKQSNIVVHMAANTHAARSVLYPKESIITNVVGTAILLDSAARNDIERFIFLSSSEVYGDQKDLIPMDENHPLAPVTPYAVSKLAGDRLAYSFFLTRKVPAIILRLFNAYGPRQHTEKVIPIFITRLIKNLPITLHQGGKQKRDWVYVDDHLRAIELALYAPKEKVIGEVFNIGTGTSTSVIDVAKIIIKELGKNETLLKVISSSYRGTMENVGISKKAKQILGWESKVSLEEGIKKTVKWYKENREWWEKLKKS